MKYLFRFLGAFLLWPLLILVQLFAWVVVNTLLALYHFDFKQTWCLVKEDFYFMLESDGSECEISKGNEIDPNKWRTTWNSYKRYYASPKDMLIDKVTKVYEA